MKVVVGIDGIEDGTAQASLAGSAALFHRASAVIPGGTSRDNLAAEPHPSYALRGHGCWTFDVDGRELIDLIGNYTALVHGNAHSGVVSAAVAAIQSGSCFALPTGAEVELAEHLVARVPALERVCFTNSGTEAVMMAIRAARVLTGKPGVVRFTDAFHGLHDSVLPESSPALGRSGSHEVLVTLPFDDLAAVSSVLASRDDLACVILDLMPNRAGLRPASREFVDGLRRLTSEAGVLLIVDEVITFRLGLRGLAHEYGLQPDLLTLGKTIGGGFPVGAFGGRADLMELFNPSSGSGLAHGGTFSANPVTMAAGLAAMRLLDADSIGQINRLGDQLREGLRRLGYTVNGRGSLSRILSDKPAVFWRDSYRKGILIGKNGLIAVSTCMDEGVIDKVLRRFES